MANLLSRLLGDTNTRTLQSLQLLLDAANALEPELAALADSALAGKTAEFKERLAGAEALDELLP